jgi:hypothetical protein
LGCTLASDHVLNLKRKGTAMTLAITELRKRDDEAEPDELAGDPFEISRDEAPEPPAEGGEHILAPGIRCDTEAIGSELPGGRSPLEIVLDASKGFIPLWAQGTILHWRFRKRSLRVFRRPKAAQAAIERLLGEAILAWGSAAPIRFAQSDSAWDFEIVMRPGDNCNPNGCVLASAFFPDAGRHELVIYPKMFTQTRQEQLETMIHEIGHIFGLRHFFALLSETSWPAQVFGEHRPFSIMNYGAMSTLTDADRRDLQTVYHLAWSGQLAHVNGTPIRFVRPFHESGIPANSMAPIAIGASTGVVEAACE